MIASLALVIFSVVVVALVAVASIAALFTHDHVLNFLVAGGALASAVSFLIMALTFGSAKPLLLGLPCAICAGLCYWRSQPT